MEPYHSCVLLKPKTILPKLCVINVLSELAADHISGTHLHLCSPLQEWCPTGQLVSDQLNFPVCV
jgi:hypothetical protein